jgi:Flp pilus assembly CpaF family ATPase
LLKVTNKQQQQRNKTKYLHKQTKTFITNLKMKINNIEIKKKMESEKESLLGMGSLKARKREPS